MNHGHGTSLSSSTFLMSILLVRDGADWDTLFVEYLIHLATPTLQAGDDLCQAVCLLYQI
jgi:hypothetical protein